jgi:hypothetical protein
MLAKVKVVYGNPESDDFIPYITPRSGLDFVTLPYKLAVILKDNYAIFHTSWMSLLMDRYPLKSYYNSFYECAKLENVSPSVFLGLSDAEIKYVNDSFNVKAYQKYIENSILFMLLHEFGHMVLQTRHSQSFFSEIDIENEVRCDEWAFQLLIKTLNNHSIPLYNDWLLTPIRETMDVILRPNESASLIRANKSARIARIISFLRIAKDNICGFNPRGNAICREINHQINVAESLDTSLRIQQYFMMYYKDHLRGFDKIMRCWNLLDSVISAGNTGRISSFCNSYLTEFIDTSGIEPGYYAEISMISDAFLNGEWAFPKNVSKSLALYEIIANVEESTTYYAMSNLEAHLFRKSFSNIREHCALSAAILYEYRFKNIKKAVYYYRIAKSISLILKPSFYDSKIQQLNSQ